MKQILRWLILGGTLFFLANALKDNWLEVSAIRIDSVGWTMMAIATGITLLAHIWAGWVWTWVLQELNQSVDARFIQVYLKTNLAKYLPGNVWHYYGRIMAAKNNHVSDSAATLSVLLEPLLMAAAALIIVLLNSQFLAVNTSPTIQIAQFFGLCGVLCAIHPRFLNSIIRLWDKIKTKQATSNTLSTTVTAIERYPWKPLLGELGFLGLRGSGFVVVVFALSPLSASQIPLLLGAFSFAWLLGLVIPGAPGGLGVFEATAIAMLQNHFPAALVISATVLYRLVSILAETTGAALAWLEEKLFNS